MYFLGATNAFAVGRPFGVAPIPFYGVVPAPSSAVNDEEPPVTREKLELSARLFAADPKSHTLLSNFTDQRDKHAEFTGRKRFY